MADKLIFNTKSHVKEQTLTDDARYSFFAKLNEIHDRLTSLSYSIVDAYGRAPDSDTVWGDMDDPNGPWFALAKGVDSDQLALSERDIQFKLPLLFVDSDHAFDGTAWDGGESLTNFASSIAADFLSEQNEFFLFNRERGRVYRVKYNPDAACWPAGRFSNHSN